MSTENISTRRMIEQVLPWGVFVILVIYTYAKFYEHAYAGFRLNSEGEVILIFTDVREEPSLRIGDRVLQIGSIRWTDFQADLKKRLIDDVQPGQVLPLIVERDGRDMQISWQVPASPSEEVRDLFFSEGWLGFFFWMAGTFTLLALRPKDQRWYLFIAFNYLTAIWLVVGSGVSFYHIWGSAILLRIIIWLAVPVYLHLHWVFPQPLGTIPRALIWTLYFIAGLLAVLEWFRVLPSQLFSTGFLIAVGGSFVLLLLHVLLQPKTRHELRFMLAIALTALFPAIVGDFLAGSLSDEYSLLAGYISGGGALLGLPLLPFAYLYSAYRRQFGDLEVRVNNFFSAFVFLLLIGAIEIPLILWADLVLNFAGKPVIIGILASILTVMAGAWAYPALQNLIEHRLLGIPLPSKRLLEVFSTQITTSISLPDLIAVLHDQVFPSLLIREFAFLQHDQGSLNVISKMGLSEEVLPDEKDLDDLIAQSGVYRSPDLLTKEQPYSWIRLILPLKLGDRLIGFWLLGRRDPDDLYSQREIPTLSSLANLTAIALSNILQTERLTSVYEANVNRYEQERLSLARDLHDSILNELAALSIRSDAPIFSPTFQQAYEGVSERLREIVNGLRPPMLAFGLKLALESFAENLRERNQEPVEILTDIQADDECRYPLVVEINLYRIVQEACENSLRYSHAKKLSIAGRLDEEQIDLRVEDNGLGLDPQLSLEFNDLLIHKHFGLAGIHERASVIGAELTISSKLNAGTQVQVAWKAEKP